MHKTSHSYSGIEITRRVNGQELREQHHFSNVVVRAAVRDMTINLFAQGTPPSQNFRFWPWRLPSQWDGGASSSITALHYAIMMLGSDTTYACYPAGTYNDPYQSLALSNYDPRRFRIYASTLGSSLAARVPSAFGAIILDGGSNLWLGSQVEGAPNCAAATDVPLSSIGVAWSHPTVGYTGTSTAGQSYLTGVDMYMSRYGGGTIRIESGADKGVYLHRHTDRVNSRIYLSNMDGTNFVASASGSVAVNQSPRMAQMNEVSVVQASKGTIAFDGHFDPGESRNTYLLRLRFEKSGSPSPSDSSQKGSYWFGIRPWYHGSGRDTSTGVPYVRYDIPHVCNSQIGFFCGGAASVASGIAKNTGSCHVGSMMGSAFDRTNQRLWMICNDGTIGSVYWWRYKSPECYHEVLVSTGTAGDPPSGTVTLASGDMPRFIDIGSDGTVYVNIYHASGGTNSGWISISPSFVATQVKRGDVGLGSSNPHGLVVDKTRYRLGGNNTITTTAGGGNLVASDGAFTQSDVGRAIKITGGADAGTYLISVVADTTHATVTTLASGAVTFAGQAATGTWQIGDRIYLFFYDATTAVNKMYYFESLAFGVLLSRNVTMTNGAQTAGGLSRGTQQSVAVDPSNGVVYWSTSDGQWQVNRYDPAANTWSRRLLTDFSKANDVSQNSSNATTATGMTDPTGVKCLAVNPHASFRELWIGTDAGWIKLNPDNFAGTFSRYWGHGGEATPYQRPAGYPRPDGSWGDYVTSSSYTSRKMFWIGFGPDGRALGVALNDLADTYNIFFEWVVYHRELDLWTTGAYEGHAMAASGGHVTAPGTLSPGFFMSPYGEVWAFNPSHKAVANAATQATMGQLEIHYQYIGGVWTPKEVVRGSLPGTLSPGLACKDLHTTLDDLVMGVKVQFTAQGGATPANSEFIGRLGALGAARTDGAWSNPAAGSAATQTFLGSGFVSGNVGDYINVSASTGNGASIGVYQITAYTNGNTVTVRKISLANFSPGNDSGTLTYQLWSMGDSTVPGPENVTVLLGNGVARDSSQDVSNIYFNSFVAKTLLAEQTEAIKFCVDPPGPPGSPGMNVYFEYYPENVNANYGPNSPQSNALPGSPLALGLQVVDGAYKFPLVGVNGGADLHASHYYSYGRCAYTNMTTGWALTVDLGLSVEIGSIIIRGTGGTPVAGRNGVIATLHNAPDGSAPVASSVVRTSGTGLTLSGGSGITAAQSVTLATRTATLSAGDFLGSSLTTGSNGQTTSGGNRFTAAAAAFSASHLMAVLKITTGSDTGSYRIINVAGDGSYVDVRNLDQTAKTWVATASGLSWDVRDAVREEDVIFPATAGKMTVERLLSTTSLEVRVVPHVSLSNVSWSVYKPTWNLVKRVSNITNATPPDVKNNKTFICHDGCEDSMEDMYWKAVLDLSDLSTAQRSGRWWKFSFSTRGTDLNFLDPSVNITTYTPGPTCFELYDLTGKLITTCKYNKLDTVDSLAATFLAAYVNRIDIICASNTAASHLSGMNGLATVGGTNGDTITLAGGNQFLGYEVRRGVSGNTVGGVSANWNVDTPVAAVDVGRTLRIASGPNAGLYKIASVVGSTAVTVTTNSGTAVTFSADAGPTPWTIHEVLVTAGVYLSIVGKESAVLALSDDFKTLTVADHFYLAGSGVAWELRYRAYSPSCDKWGQDSTSNNNWVYPLNAGYFVWDARGTIAFHAQAVGNSPVRNDGGTTQGTANFTGSWFTPDDVGRLLIIQSGIDKGRYEIASYVSISQITVKNLDTGGAVSFQSTLGSLPYKVQGERRFRASRYVTVLRN